MAVETPPAYAWDWLTRQRVAWREIRRRLVSDDASPVRVRDVPDWSADHPDLRLTVAPTEAEDGDLSDRHDYRALDTRAEVVAALRRDYAHDAGLRRTVDTAVAEIAFLGRLDVPLTAHGVRTAPRGMRWWWCHLGGTGLDDGRSGSTASDEHPSYLPRQLRFNDVLAGYGDVQDV